MNRGVGTKSRPFHGRRLLLANRRPRRRAAYHFSNTTVPKSNPMFWRRRIRRHKSLTHGVGVTLTPYAAILEGDISRRLAIVVIERWQPFCGYIH